MRALVSVVVVCAVLGLAAMPAAANTREEARRAFAAGQVADKAKDWRQAIKHYERAFELLPHHFAAYNIGSDYEQLGELRSAAEWYGRYLDLAPQSPDRDKVMRLIVELKLRPARLVVKSVPAGATVFIDGQKVGGTPYDKAIRGGGHRVAVELRGVREERDIVLEFGEPETIEFKLAGVPSDATATDVAAPATTPATPPPTDDGSSTATPTDPATTPPAPVETKVWYLVSGVGGLDARGLGSVYSGEFGLRALSYDIATRLGRALELTSLELLVRAGLLRGRVVPFAIFGYAYLGSEWSYEVGGGLRVDVYKTAKFGMALVAEITMRPYMRSFTDPMTMTMRTEESLMVPVTLSLQMMIGKKP